MFFFINIDENLLKEAKELLGMNNTSEVVNEALIDKISSESQFQLSKLGGYDPDFGRHQLNPKKPKKQ